jgi:hypothetical protein
METKITWTFEGFETTYFISDETKVEMDFHKMKVKCKLPAETKIKIINGTNNQPNLSDASDSNGNTSVSEPTTVSKTTNKNKTKLEASELLNVSEFLDPTGTTDNVLAQPTCDCGAGTVCDCILS